MPERRRSVSEPERHRLVIASGNAGKLREFRDLFVGTGIELVGFDTDVAETGATYGENARLKAVAAAERSGLTSLGDDSGLEVDALAGFPGVQSARLAETPELRVAEVIRRLAGHRPPWKARFVCVLALAQPGGVPELFEGTCSGELVADRTGEGGFGYDPWFLVPSVGRTFGEMTPAEKQRFSHRAAAVRAMLASGALERTSD